MPRKGLLDGNSASAEGWPQLITPPSARAPNLSGVGTRLSLPAARLGPAKRTAMPPRSIHLAMSSRSLGEGAAPSGISSTAVLRFSTCRSGWPVAAARSPRIATGRRRLRSSSSTVEPAPPCASMSSRAIRLRSSGGAGSRPSPLVAVAAKSSSMRATTRPWSSAAWIAALRGPSATGRSALTLRSRPSGLGGSSRSGVLGASGSTTCRPSNFLSRSLSLSAPSSCRPSLSHTA